MKAKTLPGLFRLARNKGDDALRLASNYGDDIFRAAGMYGDDMINFGTNYTDDILGAVNRMDDVNYGASTDALSDNLITSKNNIAVGMGNPPPVKEPLFKGDVRMNADGSVSVLSADDVYNIENDWLTQDMLSKGILDNGPEPYVFDDGINPFTDPPTDSRYDDPYEHLMTVPATFKYVPELNDPNWFDTPDIYSTLNDLDKLIENTPLPEFTSYGPVVESTLTSDSKALRRWYDFLNARKHDFKNLSSDTIDRYTAALAKFTDNEINLF